MTNEERAEILFLSIRGCARVDEAVKLILAYADDLILDQDLSTIDHEIIRREKAEEIYQAGMRQGKWFAMNTGPLKPVPIQPTMDESIASILGAEPAQNVAPLPTVNRW